MSNDSRTWTADEIREKVMDYGEGCASGKMQFLDSQFGINANPSQWFTIVLHVQVPTYSSDFDSEIDPDAVSGTIESVLDDNLGEALELHSHSDVDCRIAGARHGKVGFQWGAVKEETAS